MSDSVYRLFRAIVPPVRLASEFHASGAEHVPASGAYILAANHISHFDPPLLSSATGREIDFMASAEFFGHPLSAAFLRGLNAFPFDRTRRDLPSIKTSLERLERGRAVGIFVEGGIRHGSRSILGGAPINEGSAGLAQKAGAPVIPILILGTDRLYQWRAWFRKPRLFVRFGPPVLPKAEESRSGLSDRIVAGILRLLEETRAEYGVTEEEMPRSAQERWAEK